VKNIGTADATLTAANPTVGGDLATAAGGKIATTAAITDNVLSAGEVTAVTVTVTTTADLPVAVMGTTGTITLTVTGTSS